MDGDIHLVVVLIDDAYGFLVTVADGCAHQSCELAHSEIYMHNVVANLHLLQFLHGECHLAGASGVGLETVAVEAVENLVVGEEAQAQGIVGKALVYGGIYGCEGVAHDFLESLLLFLAVGENEYLITL